MRKLTFEIVEGNESKYIEFITDRTPIWTEQQYLRNRSNTQMYLISDEETEEKEPISREVKLG